MSEKFINTNILFYCFIDNNAHISLSMTKIYQQNLDCQTESIDIVFTMGYDKQVRLELANKGTSFNNLSSNLQQEGKLSRTEAILTSNNMAKFFIKSICNGK